jgi:hypothetical protein
MNYEVIGRAKSKTMQIDSAPLCRSLIRYIHYLLVKNRGSLVGANKHSPVNFQFIQLLKYSYDRVNDYSPLREGKVMNYEVIGGAKSKNSEIHYFRYILVKTFLTQRERMQIRRVLQMASLSKEK